MFLSQQQKNEIYSLTIREYSNKHPDKDGHHLAQIIVAKLEIELLSEQQRLIYNNLTSIPIRTGDLSKKVNLDSKNVSSILCSLYKEIPSVNFKMKGKNKLWYRTI